MDSFFSERALHEARRDRAGRSSCSRARARLRAARARSGCARPRSATTRTACCGARPARCTYFASDIAYHEDKLRARLRPRDRRAGAPTTTATSRGCKAAWEALGGDPERVRAPDHAARQPARGRRSARRCRSARASSCTLDDLIDDIGVDAARCFLLQRSHDTTLDLDLDAGARAVAGQPRLLRAVRARADRLDPAARPGRSGCGRRSRPTCARAGALHPSARALLKRLLEFPDEIDDAAERRAPHRLTTYALRDSRRTFSAFYRDCKVVGDAGGRRRGLPARAVACRPSACSRSRSTCSASRRRSRCSASRGR